VGGSLIPDLIVTSSNPGMKLQKKTKKNGSAPHYQSKHPHSSEEERRKNIVGHSIRL